MPRPVLPESASWIPGYENRYAITREGMVWSAPRERTKGGWLMIRVNGRGYLSVILGRTPAGQVNPQEVHRLLMRTFVGPPPPGQEVRHLDGDRLNIDLSNLAYGTRTEQRLDDVRHGTNGIVKWNARPRE